MHHDHHHTLDVHAHFLPPVYQEALRGLGFTSLDGGMPVPQWSPERALAIMDETGISVAVLSVSSPHVSFLDTAESISLCRGVNDYAANLSAAHPRRFGACALLPLGDMAASVIEYRRADEELGLHGVGLPTHVAGHYLGDPYFAPLLEAMNDRGATAFIHPTVPCCFETLGLGLPGGMMEFTFETTRTAVSLLYSGALKRFPRIRFILPHAGGTLPFLAPRVTMVGSIPILKDRAMPADEANTLLAKFFYDTALSVNPRQMGCLREFAPLSQIVFGSDFPFADENRLRAAENAFKALGFTPEEERCIRYTNAAGLFNRLGERIGASL
jgi:predicted TIM-barrel fold metal-dependent hydrolase